MSEIMSKQEVEKRLGRPLFHEPVRQRRLDERRTTVGPAHDPYGRVFYEVSLNGVAIRFMECGLAGHAVSVGGTEVLADPHASGVALAQWEELTGFSMEHWQRYYDRVHPFFDDPMGRGYF